MNIIFTRTYNLREQEIKFVQGVAGIYFIFLTDVTIEYPFKGSRLIYIGMSESKQNSIAMRLRGHLTGQSGNLGISNYAKKRKVKFTNYSADVLQNYGNDNVFDMESFFLSDFLDHHGSFPICNGQAGHQPSDARTQITAKVDWPFFQ
ncbi:MAG: GIY-YIG nuclease family protein [Candidatus Poribacteria bacterium]|nr:GIY-YIG nuclease family protein [Candidatus Poribacteria bacterium]